MSFTLAVPQNTDKNQVFDMNFDQDIQIDQDMHFDDNTVQETQGQNDNNAPGDLNRCESNYSMMI